MRGRRVLEHMQQRKLKDIKHILISWLKRMRDGSRNRNIKQSIILSLLLMSVMLISCGSVNNTKTDDRRGEYAPVETDGIIEDVEDTGDIPNEDGDSDDLAEEDEEMDEYSKELIKDALSCDDKMAEKIMRAFIRENLGLPLIKAERAEEGYNHLRIFDSNNVEYYVMVRKSGLVDMIKDVQADRIIFAVEE